MALEVGVNSYVDVANADAYFAWRWQERRWTRYRCSSFRAAAQEGRREQCQRM